MARPYLPDIDPLLVESRVLRLLRDSGLDPHPFLDALDRTRSIVSGSSALWPIHDFDFFPNDVDIYSPADTGPAMLEIMQHRFSFDIHRTETSTYSSQIGVTTVYWLTKGQSSVNLIFTEGDNAATAIFHFHSTVVMNYFNGTRLYCSIPELTLRKLAFANDNLLLDELTARRTLSCIDKYTERGFNYGYVTPHVCGVDTICPATIRTLHDGKGLTIPFSSRTTSAHPVDIYDGVRSVMWTLGGDICTGGRVFNKTFITSMNIYKAELVS